MPRTFLVTGDNWSGEPRGSRERYSKQQPLAWAAKICPHLFAAKEGFSLYEHQYFPAEFAGSLPGKR
jgi:hypothetical protein